MAPLSIPGRGAGAFETVTKLDVRTHLIAGATSELTSTRPELLEQIGVAPPRVRWPVLTN